LSQEIGSLIDTLRNPVISLPRFGKIIDQKTNQLIAYDPEQITYNQQNTILNYVNAPPMTDYSQARWLVLLKSRQTGGSLTAELAYYPKAAYTVGYDHVAIADTDDRANYLHQRVHLAHQNWPAEFRAPTIPNRESRQLTFEGKIGGKMRTMSARQSAAGIGQSISSLHASELPFWDDAAHVFNLLLPSMINRDHASMIMESTPAPQDSGSVDWWKDMCTDAKYGIGRWIYAFFPFWDGKLNQRPWSKDWMPDQEELRLLNQYHKSGLRLENLAFRRFMMETDKEIRRNPQLFSVFYPFDDVSCWQGIRNGALPERALLKHEQTGLREWFGPYQEYEQPEADAKYVIGADGAGWGVRDHAAFQVLKIYQGEWTQVACFAAPNYDPVEFTALLLATAEKYNMAEIVVESNGVGAGPLSLIIANGYRNLYYENPGKPGKTATGKSVGEMTGYLIDALQDELILNDKDTLHQLKSYRNDKLVEDAVAVELLRGTIGRRRRERHHWDKVSALKMAIIGARESTQPRKPRLNLPANVVLFGNMTWDQRQSYDKELAAVAKTQKSRTKYRPVKRRGRR
jgi:hypothetical protein